LAVETASYAEAEAGSGALTKPRAWRGRALPFSARPPRALNLVSALAGLLACAAGWAAFPRLAHQVDEQSWQWRGVPTPM
jgi:hypothetical protein